VFRFVAIEWPSKDRRKHHRVHATKELTVAWRTGVLQGVSRLGTVSLGGIFLKTAQPAPVGSMVELLIVVSPGNEVPARAIVCNARSGGMGVKFFRMLPEDRSRLNEFLNEQLKAAGIQPGPLTTNAARHPPTSDVVPGKNVATSDSRRNMAAEANVSEEELRRCLTLAQKGTHYQLLEITSDCCKDQVKKAFYRLARKFHPDRHMSRPDWKEMLQQVMGRATVAYETLSDDEDRFQYDKRLATGTLTESQESIDDYAKIAAACFRDQNVAGFIFWMRKCVHNAPAVAKYRVSLAGGLMLNEGQRWEAVQQFEKAIELDPFDSTAYLQFGALYEEMRLPWRARSLYSKVLEMDPSHSVAKARIAKLVANERKKPASKSTNKNSRT
jgi:curved DNA-binding protein CbpA